MKKFYMIESRYGRTSERIVPARSRNEAIRKANGKVLRIEPYDGQDQLSAATACFMSRKW